MKPAMSGAQTKYCAGTTMGLISRMGVLSIAVLLNQMGLTKKFSSGAGCQDCKPRKAVMPAPSAATAGSALLGSEHQPQHPADYHEEHEQRDGQPFRGFD